MVVIIICIIHIHSSIYIIHIYLRALLSWSIQFRHLENHLRIFQCICIMCLQIKSRLLSFLRGIKQNGRQSTLYIYNIVVIHDQMSQIFEKAIEKSIHYKIIISNIKQHVFIPTNAYFIQNSEQSRYLLHDPYKLELNLLVLAQHIGRTYYWTIIASSSYVYCFHLLLPEF